MGYYDTQHVQPNAGGQPYNVKDILLATQGVTGGLDKLLADASADKKAQQQMKANVYVSELLGKATPDNYKQQLLQAGTMAPYASAELMNQVKDTRGQMQYDEGVATHSKERGEDIAQRGVENTYRDKTFAHTVSQDNYKNQFDREKFAEDTRRYGMDYALKARELSENAELKKLMLNKKDSITPSQKFEMEKDLNKPTKIEYVRDGVKHTTVVPYGEYMAMSSNGRYNKGSGTTYNIGGGQQKTLAGSLVGLAPTNSLLDDKELLMEAQARKLLLDDTIKRQGIYGKSKSYLFGE